MSRDERSSELLLEEAMETVQAIVMERWWQQRAKGLGVGLDSAGD